MSGDTLKVGNNQVVNDRVDETVVKHYTAVVKPYTSTYYPTLLALDIDKGAYSIASEALESIMPSNIMLKAAEPSEEELANFRFYEHQGVEVPLSELELNNEALEAQIDTSTVAAHQSTVDSLAVVAKDSLALRPAIDSLPKLSFPSNAFSISEVDSSLLNRFDFPELISRDSYILLESHPELVFGKSSKPVQKVSVAKVGIAKDRETQNLGFVSFSILTLGLIFFIVSLKFQYKNVESVIKGFFSLREARRTYQSRSLNFKRFTYLSTVFYLLTFSVFLVQLAQKYGGNTVKELGALSSFLAAFAILVALYFIRIWGWGLLGNISRSRDLFEEFKFNHLLFYAVFSLAIFPLQVVASYAEKQVSLFFIQLSIYFVVIILLLFIIRSFRLFLSHRVSFFFWFLYFCTLEILPVLLALHFAGVLG